MSINNVKTRFWVVFSGVLGVLYLILGLLNIIAGLGFHVYMPLLVPPSEAVNFGIALNGTILLIIGLILTTGSYYLNSNDKDTAKKGYSFIYGGLILATIFGCLQALILIANGIEVIVFANEDLEAWTILSDFTPLLWLMFLTAPTLGYL
ncbi:MAG: hypothetical protein ACTSYQ_01395, partial [Candidatus Odinarchaeia archaeon]